MVVVLVTVAVLGVAWLVRRWQAGRRSPQDTAAELFDPGDVADLEERFHSIATEIRRSHDALLVDRLRHLVCREVPARRVTAAPGVRTARVHFADGTTVLVQGDRPGDIATLVRWAYDRSVLARACRVDERGTSLVFEPRGRRGSLELTVTGMDQPD